MDLCGQMGALPDAAVSPRRSQLGFGVRTKGTPGCLPARLCDGTSTGPNGTDVCRGPQRPHQAVHPALQLGPRQCGVPLGRLHLAQVHGDVQHGVEAMKALLHIAVLSGAVVELQGVAWGREREEQ